MRFIIVLLFSCVLSAATLRAQLMPTLGAQRAGTASVQFLKIGVGARAGAMGESFVSIANDASALYWNPAGISQFKDDQVLFAHTSWLVDMQHEFIGAVYHLSPDDAVGLSVTTLHTEDMPVTTELQPLGNGTYFHYGDMAVGVTYSRKLTEQFSFGGTVRYFEETLDVLKLRGTVIDLGTYYWTGLGSLRFSAVVSNFGNQVSASGSVEILNGSTVSQFQQFSPPTVFRFGFALEPFQNESHSLTTSLQLNHPNDNSENLSMGAEYQYMKTFFARGGYKMNVDEEGFSFGVGLATSLNLFSFSLDYGYAPFRNLGGVHRISMFVKL
ncbi:MAG: PorV/PorQ family protein [Ignavibacteriales bacterium]|nr:PorV/PorQ family protein [Ignavibacteriales bacterium]